MKEKPMMNPQYHSQPYLIPLSQLPLPSATPITLSITNTSLKTNLYLATNVQLSSLPTTIANNANMTFVTLALSAISKPERNYK